MTACISAPWDWTQPWMFGSAVLVGIIVSNLLMFICYGRHWWSR